MAKGLTDAKYYAAIASVLRKNSADAEGTVTPPEMAQKLQAMAEHCYGEGYDRGQETGYSQGYGVAQQMLARTTSEFTDEELESLGDGAFYGSGSLESLTLPNLTRIGASAFYKCTSLTELSFPKVTDMGSNAFHYCDSLQSISMPAMTTAGPAAFGNCFSLEGVYFPKLTDTADRMFQGCTAIKSAILPAVNTVAPYCFSGCVALTEFVNAVTSVGEQGFYGCTALRELTLPMCAKIENKAFLNCTALERLDIGLQTTTASGGYINAQAFSNCSKLKTLILRWVIPLRNANALSGTPIASGSGLIYVPSNLVSAYRSATNWSTYASRITAIPAGM